MKAAIGLLTLLLAAPVSASELTFENLWEYPDITITHLDLWLYNPDNTLFHVVEDIDPVLPGDAYTLLLPTRFDDGFRFGTLDASGSCPHNCGWGSSVLDVENGAWIGGDRMAVNVLWPTYDGGWAPIVSMTYTPDAQPVPEPGTLALLGLGAVVFCREDPPMTDPHYLAFEAAYQYYRWRNTRGSFWLYRACAEMWAVVGRRKQLDRPRPHPAAGGRAILMERQDGTTRDSPNPRTVGIRGRLRVPHRAQCRE